MGLTITDTDLDNHFVEVPTRTGARTAAAKIARNQSAELQEPASNRFVRNIDATLGQQILDITKRKREPGGEPDRMLDDLGRNAMSLERYWGHTPKLAAPAQSDHRLNVSMPIWGMSDKSSAVMYGFVKFEGCLGNIREKWSKP